MIIAVIGILAGILIPIFGRAKQQARRSQCASNLSQLGRAFGLYTADWGGVYPAPGGISGSFGYWVQSGNGGLVSYIGRNGGLGTVWCCPELTQWDGRYSARTYSMNSYLRNPPDREIEFYYTYKSKGLITGCPENQLEDPRRTILLYEGVHITKDWPEGQDYIYRCGNWTCVSGVFTKEKQCLHTQDSWKPWHGSKNNYLYCDGHIVARPPGRQVKAGSDAFSYAEMYEWYVHKSILSK